MATYKEIKGTTVKVRSSSMPTAYPQVAGELYYNSSNGKYEFLGLAAGAWSSGGNLNTARQSGGGLGIQTASLMVAGETGSILNIVENYDGTSWTEVADINTARKANTALGTTSAGLTAGGTIGPPGRYQTLNEIWNGSGWTESGDLNTGRGGVGGTNTAYDDVLCFAGTGPSAKNENWNGASWSEIGDLNTGRFTVGGTGSPTAGLCFGGRTPGTPHSAVTEEWSGSSITTKVLTD